MIARRSARIGRGWAYISNLSHRNILSGWTPVRASGFWGRIPAYVLVVFWGPSSKNDERRPVTLTRRSISASYPERSTGDSQLKGNSSARASFATTRESYTIPARHRRSSMDFIERIFGVSPDGGNGTLELLYVLAIAAAIILISYKLYRRKASLRTQSPLRRHTDLQRAAKTRRIRKT